MLSKKLINTLTEDFDNVRPRTKKNYDLLLKELKPLLAGARGKGISWTKISLILKKRGVNIPLSALYDFARSSLGEKKSPKIVRTFRKPESLDIRQA